ncbi:T9SS type A sorting domain-containing protein [Spirosoma sp.]|uniref:T9SS type A sorting domain-containing protein n=1 Tax=Spirosoma sp. TaxID=1899569 RepID=UPI003B3A928A
MTQVSLPPILRYLVLLLLLSPLRSAFAQCDAPTASTQTITDQTCPGTGSINVTSVAGGSGTYQYALYNQANTVEVKPFQDAALLTNVTGNNTVYTLRIRSVCTNPAGFSPEFTQQVTVGGVYNQPVINGITPSPSQCNNGRLTVSANGGVEPLQYALVNSLNDTEPVGSPVRPQQSSNEFSGLAAGTYFVRVYDACGSFVTQSVTVPAFAPSDPNPFQSFSLTYIPCDQIRGQLYFFTDRFIADPATQLTVTYPDGTTAPLIVPDPTYPIVSFDFPISKLGTVGSGAFPDNIGNWPKTFMFTFINACGQVFTFSKTLQKPCAPSFKELGFSNSTCTGVDMRFGFTLDSNCPFENYIHYSLGDRNPIEYSTDGGTTWQTKVPSGGTLFPITLPYNSTYNVCVRYCGQVYCTTGTTPVSSPPSLSLEYNSTYACPGNASIVALASVPGTFSMVSAPAGQTAVAPVQYQPVLSWFYNVIPGSYTIRFTDNCGQSVERSLTLSPYTLSFTYAFDCAGNLVVTAQESMPSSTAKQAQLVNSAGQVVSTEYVGSNGNSLIIITFPASTINALPTGDYTIRVSQTVNTCYVEKPVTLSSSLLNLSQSLFTSACGTTGTIVAVAQGATDYQYSLNEGSLTGPLVAGPQTSNIFNNLDPNKTYVLSVTDECGRGTNFTSSFSNAKPVVLSSAQTQPCPGQSFQLSVNDTPGATYQWFKDGNPIPGATSYTLDFPSIQTSDAGTYAAEVSLGSCVVLTNTINLTNGCGSPLPISLRSFTASILNNQAVQLHWATAIERNNSHFLLERSKDLVGFEPVARIKAKEGNSFHSRAYSYTDEAPYQGTSFYRLRQVDQDGTFTVFPALSVVLRTDGYGVYPNPVSRDGSFTLRLDEPKTALVNLYNAQGQACGLQTLSSSAGSLSLKPAQPLPSGIYILTVSERGQLRQFRLVIP